MKVKQPATEKSLARIGELFTQIKAVRSSDPHQALALCDEVIGLATSTGPPAHQELLQALRLRCALLFEFSNYPAAVGAAFKALTLCEALGDQEQGARTLHLLGTVYGYQGLFPDSLDYLLKANKIFSQRDRPDYEPILLSKNFNTIGYTYVLMEQPEKALPYLQKSLGMARESGDRLHLANVLDSLANAYLKLGALDQALAHALESVCCAREMERAENTADCLLTTASIQLERGEYAAAIEATQEALSLAQRHGFRRLEAEAFQKLGDAYQRQELNDPAREYLGQAVVIAREIDAKPALYQCLYELALLCKKTGDYPGALEYYEQFHRVKSEVFSEQADWRFKNLEITYQVEQTRKENEIYAQANRALQKEIAERKEAQALAEKLAITDALTGLYNRRYFFGLIEREMKRVHRYKRAFALVLIDLDDFKRVNDTYGHPAGDSVLSTTASLLRSSIRTGDVACRYGGEEFILLMPETEPEQAVLVIERVRKALSAQAIETDRGSISITFSAGVSGLRASEAHLPISQEQLLKLADQALYTAKRNGKNRTEILFVRV
jgi:diguanylate cyclase (GGDEF)-like protein